MKRARTPLTLILLVILLAPGASSETSAVIENCLERIDLDELSQDAGCVSKIVQAGPDAINRMAAKLELTAVQPEMSIAPPGTRLRREPTGEVDMIVALTNRSTKPALVRTRAINISMIVSFQTFGFTWDGGMSSSQQPRVSLQRTPEVAVIGTDEICSLAFRIPVAMQLSGRYDFSYTITYDGPLTIPQRETPGWTTKGSFFVDYLMPSSRGRRAMAGDDGTLRLDAGGVAPVSSVGESVMVALAVRNTQGAEAALMPAADSFFAAPYWFVIVDSATDNIVSRGNLIPLEDMRPEPTSTEVRVTRIGPRETINIRGAMMTRLRQGTYSGFVGCTSFRDIGQQDLWLGESSTGSFSFTILP